MIELRNVTKRIYDDLVPDHINLTLNKAEIYGFVGQNGSGKTMLFRAICGLIHLSEGEVIMDGQEADFRNLPKQVGLLLEAPASLNGLSGAQNLKMLAYLTPGVTDRQIAEMLETVGLSQAANKRYGKYSLGMKQRLELAYAFLNDSKLILLDEPTNALDPRGVEILMQLVELSHKRGATILIASHDGTFLESLTDRIIRMAMGRIIEAKD